MKRYLTGLMMAITLAATVTAHAETMQVGYSIRIMENAANGAVSQLTGVDVVTLDGKAVQVPVTRHVTYLMACPIHCGQEYERNEGLEITMTPMVKDGVIETWLDVTSTARHSTPMIVVGGKLIPLPQDMTFHVAQTIAMPVGEKVIVPFGELLKFDSEKGLPIRSRYMIEITAHVI